MPSSLLDVAKATAPTHEFDINPAISLVDKADSAGRLPAPLPFTPSSGGSSGSSSENRKLSFFDMPTNEPTDTKIYVNTPTYYNPNDIPKRYDKYLLGENNEAINADIQSGWSRIKNAGANLVTKAGAFAIQNTGFIAGAIPAAVGGIINEGEKLTGHKESFNDGNAVSYMTDNLLTNLGDATKEWIQEKAPIYKSEKYTDGNIWQKLGTSSWWLDDAIDRLALTGAMLLPGFAEAKGIGLFGAEMAGEALIPTSLGSKAVQAIAETPGLYGKIGRVMGNNIYKVATEGAADLNTATALKFASAIKVAQKLELYSWNVIGQSALNGREAQVSIKRALEEQRNAGYNAFTDAEIDNKSAEGAAKGFWYSAPLSLAGSLYELPQIFSTAKTAENMLKKYFTAELAPIENAIAQRAAPSIGKLAWNTFKTGLEHGQNESAQVAIGRYLEENIAGKRDGIAIKKDERAPLIAMFEDWKDNVNDPNGQNNIALGTIQGMLMTLIGHGKSVYKGDYAKADKQTKTFVDNINKAVTNRRYFSTPEDLIAKDEQGKPILNNEGKVTYNQARLAELGVGIIDTYKKGLERIDALNKGDYAAAEKLNFDSLVALSRDFMDGPSGVEYLSNLLRFEAKNQKENVGRVNDSENGIEITPEVQLQRNIDYVTNLKKAYDAIDERHAGFTKLNIDTTNKHEVSFATEFLNQKKNAQYENAADQIFYNSVLSKNNFELNSLGITEKVTEPSSPQEVSANFLIEQNTAYKEALNNSKEEYKGLINKDTIRAGFEIGKKQMAEIVAKATETAETAKASAVAVKAAEEADAKIPMSDAVKVKSNFFERVKDVPYSYVINNKTINGNLEFDKTTGIMNFVYPNEQGELIKQEVTNEDFKSKKVIATTNNKTIVPLSDEEYAAFEKDKTVSPERLSDIANKVKNNETLTEKETTIAEDKAEEIANINKDTEHSLLNPLNALTSEQSKALDSFLNSKDERQLAKFEKHSAILGKFLTELNERQEKTNNLIEQAKKNIERSTQEAEEQKKEAEANIDKRYKVLTYKEAGKAALNTINRLTKDIERFKNELPKLEDELDEIISTKSYVTSLIDNLDNYSADIKVFEKELKKEIANLDDLHKATETQISTIKKLIAAAEDALNTVRERLQNIISQLAKKNPEIAIPEVNTTDPTLFNDYLKELDESTVDQLNKDLLDIVDKEEIHLTSVKIFKLFEDLNKANEVLSQLDKETKAKKEILARFDATINEIKKGEGQLTKISKNGTLIDELKATHDAGFQTSEFVDFEEHELASKKEFPEKSTISSTKGLENKVPADMRAQRFGFDFHKLKASGKVFKGRIITESNEDKLGLTGLINLLHPTGSDRSLSRTIALVITNEKGQPVDKEGNVIPADVNILDHVIAQMFPEENLEQYYFGSKETMFRREDLANMTDVITRKATYKVWRDAKVKETKLGKPLDIDASFGHLDFFTRTDDKGEITKDTKAKSNVIETELISSEELATRPVIQVATSNDTMSSDNGSVSFKSPLGSVFLAPEGGLLPLRSRKFTNKEAENIYNVILQITKNIQEAKTASTTSENNKLLFDWLKSTIFWGKANNTNKATKAISKNNVWFDTIEVEGKRVSKLFIGTDLTFDFTPVSLEQEENKVAIISALENIYNNVQNHRLGKINFKSDYWEITGIGTDGKPTARKWNNYQTYLLSNKTPDGKSRSNDEIPLTTNVRPIIGDSMNRNGIYFTLQGELEIPRTNSTKQTTVQKDAPQEEAPKEEAPKGPPAIKYDGSENILSLSKEPSEDIKYQIYLDKVLPLLTENTFTDEKTKNDFINKLLKEGIFVVTINDGDGTNPGILDKIAAAKGTTPDVIERSLIKGLFDNVSGPMINHLIKEENAEEVTPKDTSTEEDDEYDDLDTEYEDDNDDVPFRLEALDKIMDFKSEDWVKAESWLKENFPMVPVHRLKNVIQASNGKQAFGMFKDAALYIYEHAEEGTVYHEVFHAVWNMFTTPKERASIIKEFKSKKGTFTERLNGEKIAYKDATPYQLQDEIAENFRETILAVKEPLSFLRSIFRDIKEFIKKFFLGKESSYNTRKLFNKIGNGYYAKYNENENALSLAKVGFIHQDSANGTLGVDYRIDIPSGQLHDLVQHMTYSLIKDLIKTNEGLFELTDKIAGGELYKMLREEILGNNIKGGKLGIIKREIRALGIALREGNVGKRNLKLEDVSRRIASLKDLRKKVIENWDDIVEKHKEHISVYDITFDENEEALVDDDTSKGEDYYDSNKIDVFKKADLAVKLLFATLPDTHKSGPNQGKINQSTIGGVSLVNSDKVFITLLNKLHDSVDPDDMLGKLAKLAKQDINYATLYGRLAKVAPGKTIDGSTFTENDLALVSAFWKAIKKQAPDVLTVEILQGGEVAIGDTNLTNVAKQERYKLTNFIIDTIKKDKTEFFTYDTNGKYNATNTLKTFVLNAKDISTYLDFLQNLGININKVELETLFNELPRYRKTFLSAVEGLKITLSEIKNTPILNKRVINSDSNLAQLGTIKGLMENPVFESTYYSIGGEKAQTFMGVNFPSMVHSIFKKISKISDLDTTRLRYLRTDAFAKDSMVLKKMFAEDGTKIEGSEDLLMQAHTDGTIDQENGTKSESSKQNWRQKLVQEIALNLSGVYLNLVPGDAAIDYATRLHHKGDPFVSAEDIEFKSYHEIFKNYFKSEIGLVSENRIVAKDRNNQEMRFFKDILGEELHKDILHARVTTELTAEDLYGAFDKRIEQAVDKYILTQTNESKRLFYDYDIIKRTKKGEDSFTFEGVSNKKMTEAESNKQVKELTINYIIANIEFHKLIYSDPYLYNDELKRVKNFNSPRQALMADSKLVIDAMEALLNKGFEKGSIGYTNIREYFRTVTIDDVLSIGDLKKYDEDKDAWEETDGGGVITLKAYRVFRFRAGNWSSKNEAQYRHDVKYEEIAKKLDVATSKDEIEILTYKLAEHEKLNPGVSSTYTPLKPIVAGSKDNGKNYNDTVMDKYALMPYSFRILHKLNPNSNAIKLYNKMMAEDTDYAVYKSGRKVGIELIHQLFDKDGKFNTELFESKELTEAIDNGTVNPSEKRGITNIPFSIISVQTDVPSKENHEVTQGTQITKLVTLDFMQAGVPKDFVLDVENADFTYRWAAWAKLSEEEKESKSELYKLINHNQNLLEAKIKLGYTSLLNKLGLSETTEGYIIKNRDKLVTTLKTEMLKREVNDNIIATMKAFENEDIVLESTPLFQQLRYVLYSIANSSVVKPKISGGQKVQISSNLLEDNKVVAFEKNGKTYFKSDILKFYSKGEVDSATGKVKKTNVAEIMVGRWFDSPLSDEALLKYLNTTEEGQQILRSVAFRTPTQKQNSIDAFVIKQFLPKEFGDSIVVPSALVRKSGTDFDIDKLSIYLKNVIINLKGEPKLVKFLTKDNSTVEERYINWVNKSADKTIKSDNKIAIEKAKEIAAIDNLPTLEEFGKRSIYDQNTAKALENEYIQSLDDLITHPENFDRLVEPNSAKSLKDLSKEITGRINSEESISSNSPGFMLNRIAMSRLRQDFLEGKQGIAIAAIGQTNHSQNQRSLIFLDDSKVPSEKDEYLPGWLALDRHYLGDGSILFKDKDDNDNFNTVTIGGKSSPTLSMDKTKNSPHYISDIIGMFIDGFVDISKGAWIMELGATPRTVSTWLFLIKIGVPVRDVSFFMNQPIIIDYLKELDKKGIKGLRKNSVAKSISFGKYSGNGPEFTSINYATLDSMLGKSAKDLNPEEAAYQRGVLKEFLKYATMAQHLLMVTQGTNMDTAQLNDPALVYKKQKQLEKSKLSIFSGVEIDKEGNFSTASATESILKNSFVGKLNYTIIKYGKALSQVLITNKKDETHSKISVGRLLEEVIDPFTDLPDRAFLKISQKIVGDLFDWAVQTNTKMNDKVRETLIGTQDKASVAIQVMDFVNKVKEDTSHPLYDNALLGSLVLTSGKNKNTPDNLSIEGRDNKTYDQNLIIAAFQEVKEYLATTTSPEEIGLYDKLLSLIILQSGLSNSPIAFSKLIPFEDFNNIYNATLSSLESLPNLYDFHKLDVFQRNNWNNTDIVSYYKSTLEENEYDNFLRNPATHYNHPELLEAYDTGKAPFSCVIPTDSYMNDYITYSEADTTIPREERIIMRKNDDTSYIKKHLMRRVKTFSGNDLITSVETLNGSYNVHTYVAVNAWGDSFRAQEFYGYKKVTDNNTSKLVVPASVLDNGYQKVEAQLDQNGNQISSYELSDAEVINLIKEGTKENNNSLSLDEDNQENKEDNEDDNCVPF